MQHVYLGALAFGGLLVLASLVLGAGQKDLDKGFDKDAGGGLDWLPVASLRFWTFVLAFGGLAGTALTHGTSLGAAPVAALAFGVGWASGIGVVAATRAVRRGSVGSELAVDDLAGEGAVVVVGLRAGQAGKVRVSAKGRVHDLMAVTDDEQPLDEGTPVTILGEAADGQVTVTRALT
jgi:hypothetical protein